MIKVDIDVSLAEAVHSSWRVSGEGPNDVQETALLTLIWKEKNWSQ